jgi:transcriptional regulator with XRE-family HTH domain
MVAANLRHYCTMRGWAQQRVAELIAVSTHRFQKYETGTNHISAVQLFVISRALAIPFAAFFLSLTGVRATRDQ